MSNEKSICIIQFSDRAFCKGSNHGERCGFAYVTEDVDVSIAGAGDVSAYVTEDVDISIVGSGDVTIKGNPKKVKQKINGSGRVSVK